MAESLTLNGKNLTARDLMKVVRGQRIVLAPAALARAKRSHAVLVREAGTRIIYGVNTGFGPMASTLIGKGDLKKLQRNLVRSHACGAGEPVEDAYVIAAMAVRLNTLLRGDSGVSVGLLKRIAALIHARCIPIVPEHGGVGASGDLIQLSHIALGIMGEGEVRLRGVRMSAANAFKKLALKPYVLGPKEGLALINGTSFMAAVAALSVVRAEHMLSAVVRSSALALEAARAFDDCLSPYLHAARPHPGQHEVAATLRALTRDSSLLRSRAVFEKSASLQEHTTELERAAQDVYSLRCAPQILGPALETLRSVAATVEIELNSATDNPLIDAQTGRIMHGGNFHGEYIAVAADKLKAALIKVSILCERRINFFLHDKVNGLFPPFVNLGTPGLTLGLQGLQFTATSTVAQNQSLAFPHSLHSIPSNADNQDVVSMGADAALMAARVLENTALVGAIELLVISQALAAQKAERLLGREGKALLKAIRCHHAPSAEDWPLREKTQNLAGALLRGEVCESIL